MWEEEKPSFVGVTHAAVCFLTQASFWVLLGFLPRSRASRTCQIGPQGCRMQGLLSRSCGCTRGSRVATCTFIVYTWCCQLVVHSGEVGGALHPQGAPQNKGDLSRPAFSRSSLSNKSRGSNPDSHSSPVPPESQRPSSLLCSILGPVVLALVSARGGRTVCTAVGRKRGKGFVLTRFHLHPWKGSPCP